MNDQTIEKLVSEYVENIEHYLAAQRERRFVDGNKFVDRASHTVKRLRHDFGKQGRKALLALMSNPDAGIQSCVAADSIDYATAKAIEKLNEIAKKNIPFESMIAEYCLKEWSAGKKQMPGGNVKLGEDEVYS